MATKPPVFKIPKSIGACADKLYETRQRRLEIQKEVDTLSAQETQLKNYIIDTLPKSEASGVAGKLCRVSVVTKKVPQVKDWDVFYKHIKKTGEFELLSRSIGKAAIEERWENGKKIPGVESFDVTTVSINKV